MLWYQFSVWTAKANADCPADCQNYNSDCYGFNMNHYFVENCNVSQHFSEFSPSQF